MAKLIHEATELSPGVFKNDELPTFDMAQAWQKNAYWNMDYFGDLSGPDTLHQVNNLHGLPTELNFIYSGLVLRMGSMQETRFKISRDYIASLGRGFSNDPDALTSLEELATKVDQKEAQWRQARCERMGELIVSERGHLHVLITSQEKGRKGKIEGFFGKLWGVTTESQNDKLAPVVVGKDRTPTRLARSAPSVWLYVGAIDAGE